MPPENSAALKSTLLPANSASRKLTVAPENSEFPKLTVPPENWAFRKFPPSKITPVKSKSFPHQETLANSHYQLGNLNRNGPSSEHLLANRRLALPCSGWPGLRHPAECP